MHVLNVSQGLQWEGLKAWLFLLFIYLYLFLLWKLKILYCRVSVWGACWQGVPMRPPRFQSTLDVSSLVSGKGREHSGVLQHCASDSFMSCKGAGNCSLLTSRRLWEIVIGCLFLSMCRLSLAAWKRLALISILFISCFMTTLKATFDSYLFILC